VADEPAIAALDLRHVTIHGRGGADTVADAGARGFTWGFDMAKRNERNRTTEPRASTEGTRPARARGGTQPGPQDHAEGEHGAKTRQRILEQLQSGRHEEPVKERRARAHLKAGWEGKRRLVEDRQQHDEAEKNSERARLYDAHMRGDDVGPSDNRGSLHGVLGHKSHRADYKTRGPDGLRTKE
jgi:hypothetical protein